MRKKLLFAAMAVCLVLASACHFRDNSQVPVITVSGGLRPTISFTPDAAYELRVYEGSEDGDGFGVLWSARGPGGFENILLFESARKLSRQILVVQEDERRTLSLQIHDDPLHQITYAISVMDHILVKGGATGMGATEPISRRCVTRAGARAAASRATREPML